MSHAKKRSQKLSLNISRRNISIYSLPSPHRFSKRKERGEIINYYNINISPSAGKEFSETFSLFASRAQKKER
jgi:hypothetical protein